MTWHNSHQLLLLTPQTSTGITTEIWRKWQIWATHLPPNPKHCSGVQQIPCNLTPRGGGTNSSGDQLFLNNCWLHPAVKWRGSGACSLMKGQAGTRNQQDVTLLPLLWVQMIYSSSLLPWPQEHNYRALPQSHPETWNEEGKMSVHSPGVLHPAWWTQPKLCLGALYRYFTGILSSIHRCKNPWSKHTNPVRYV